MFDRTLLVECLPPPWPGSPAQVLARTAGHQSVTYRLQLTDPAGKVHPVLRLKDKDLLQMMLEVHGEVTGGSEVTSAEERRMVMGCFFSSGPQPFSSTLF